MMDKFRMANCEGSLLFKQRRVWISNVVLADLCLFPLDGMGRGSGHSLVARFQRQAGRYVLRIAGDTGSSVDLEGVTPETKEKGKTMPCWSSLTPALGIPSDLYRRGYRNNPSDNALSSWSLILSRPLTHVYRFSSKYI